MVGGGVLSDILTDLVIQPVEKSYYRYAIRRI